LELTIVFVEDIDVIMGLFLILVNSSQGWHMIMILSNLIFRVNDILGADILGWSSSSRIYAF